MKFIIASSLGLSVLLLGLFQTPARGYTIDLFRDTDDGTNQTATDSSADTNPVQNINGQSTALDDVIGGVRELNVNKGSGGLSVSSSVIPSINLFTFSVDATTIGDFELVWDNNGGGLGDTDLTDDGGITQDAFEILIEDSDKDVYLEFEIFDGGTSTKWGQTIIEDTTEESVLFPFSNFDNSVLQSADSIALRSVNAPARLDLEFSLVSTTTAVPFELYKVFEKR